MPSQAQDACYVFWAVDSEGRIGLFVGNNPSSAIAPEGRDPLDWLSNHASESYQRGGLFDQAEGILANGLQAALGMLGGDLTKTLATKSGCESGLGHTGKALTYGAATLGAIAVSALTLGEGDAPLEKVVQEELVRADAIIAAKTATTVDQYALKAVEDGFYPVMKRGFAEPQGGVWLNAGDVWKYGTTKNPATRYPESFYREWGLQYEPQVSGTLQEALAAEKANVLRYEAQHGVLPPGNKIRR